MEIIAQFPKLRFLPTGYFAYDAAEEVINYDPDRIEKEDGKLALLHEVAHAKLKHFHYRFDFELFVMEVQAWHLTRKLANKYAIKINDSFIKECIDSYDKWLSKRATCPTCKTFNIQLESDRFQCYLCQTTWKVSENIQHPVRRIIQK